MRWIFWVAHAGRQRKDYSGSTRYSKPSLPTQRMDCKGHGHMLMSYAYQHLCIEGPSWLNSATGELHSRSSFPHWSAEADPLTVLVCHVSYFPAISEPGVTYHYTTSVVGLNTPDKYGFNNKVYISICSTIISSNKQYISYSNTTSYHRQGLYKPGGSSLHPLRPRKSRAQVHCYGWCDVATHLKTSRIRASTRWRRGHGSRLLLASVCVES